MRPKGNRVTRQRPHIGCGALRTGVLRGLLAELVRRALRRQTTPSRLLPDRLDVSREHPTTGFVVETLNESSDDLARRLRFDRVEKPRHRMSTSGPVRRLPRCAGRGGPQRRR